MISAIAITPDGKYALFSGGGGLWLWDIKSKKLVRTSMNG